MADAIHVFHAGAWRSVKDMVLKPYGTGPWTPVKDVWVYERISGDLDPPEYAWRLHANYTPPEPSAGENLILTNGIILIPKRWAADVNGYGTFNNTNYRRSWQLRHGTSTADGGLFDETFTVNNTISRYYEEGTDLPSGTYYFRSTYEGSNGRYATTWINSDPFTVP